MYCVCCRIRGTETCGSASFEGVGKTAFDDPCQPSNRTRPTGKYTCIVLCSWLRWMTWV